MKFLCEQCKAKYQIADEKAAGKTVRMKCRKCGHLIEVRSTTADSAPPPAASTGPAARPAAPKAPARPAPPRAGALASSLGTQGTKAPARPADKPAGALAGAFKSAVAREREESSAPFDMDDLSPSDEWYVAINGVPVGPIRIAEVRRKAALGAVTEESLCWQEGLDEWRPVRSFPELAAIVRESLASGRSSLPPSTPGERSSGVPAAGTRPSRPPHAPAPTATSPRPPPARPVAAPAPAVARSNVVPITSRLATAEKFDIDDDPDGATRMQPGIPVHDAVVADPFANPPAPAGATAVLPAMSAASAHIPPEPSVAVAAPTRKSPPWMAIAMVAAAVAFGVTAALALVLRPAAPPPAPVVVQVPGTPAAPTATTTSTGVPTATDATNPDVPGAPSSGKGPVAMGGGPSKGSGSGGSAPTSTAASKGPLDLGGLGGSPRPDDPSGDQPKAPGQCFSSGQVSQVIGLHQPGIRRACWERNPTTKPTVNVNVSLTIGPDGAPQSVNASADELTVAKCVENDVRTWRFPAMGCSQQTSFSFHFVRQ